MIFGIGLPRCAGQTLGAALQILHPEQPVWHSITGAKWDVLKPEHVGAVEVYAPYAWLERHWPNSLYIANWRECNSWIKSCERVWHQSQQNGWNHPLWEYPPSSWSDYYEEYWEGVSNRVPEHRLLWWNILEDPSWNTICDFLDLPIPDQPFPNSDVHGRMEANEAEIAWPSPWARHG
jgi:hypothetical protein